VLGPLAPLVRTPMFAEATLAGTHAVLEHMSRARRPGGGDAVSRLEQIWQSQDIC
jgi:hypothetical protein